MDSNIDEVLLRAINTLGVLGISEEDETVLSKFLPEQRKNISEAAREALNSIKKSKLDKD